MTGGGGRNWPVPVGAAPLAAFSLIIDHRIMNHIIKYTEEHAFIAVLYARDAYEAKNLDILYL